MFVQFESCMYGGLLVFGSLRIIRSGFFGTWEDEDEDEESEIGAPLLLLVGGDGCVESEEPGTGM